MNQDATNNPQSEWERFWTTHPLKPLPGLAWELFWDLVCYSPTGFLQLFRLILFAILLLPAWYKGFWFYLTSENMKRNLRYGCKPRNSLDIYLPEHVYQQKCPVVIFVTGGAWIIGYKTWGLLFARVLMRFGIICVLGDYRNFPQGTVEDMLEDVNQLVTWTFNNIDRYGGDTERIYYVGQSAGAHLGSLLYLNRVPIMRKLKSFIGLSGPFDMVGMEDYFHHRGLHRPLLHMIFGGKEKLEAFSPMQVVARLPKLREDDEDLPQPIWLLHGGQDKTVPFQVTVDFAHQLRQQGWKCNYKIYPFKTHSSPMVEDLIQSYELVRGGDVVLDIVDIVFDRPNLEYFNSNYSENLSKRERVGSWENTDPLNPVICHDQLVPVWITPLAEIVNPF